MAKPSRPTAKKPAAKKPQRSMHTASDDVNYGDIANQYQQDRSTKGFEFTKNKHKVIIVPYTHKGKSRVYLKEVTHFNVHPDHKALRCTDDSTCPICDFVQDLKDANDTKRAEEMRASTKYLMNIIDVENLDKGVQTWRAPIGVWREMMNCISDAEEFPDALAMPGGLIFMVEKEGVGRTTKYTCRVSQQRHTIDKPKSGTVNFDDRAERFGQDVDLEAIVESIR